ncbi:hypothetical protein PGT21_015006 [Puccinia graminis f. sp. tritici]|uniref:Uncharacterized protein n=1 Tax=Puccinia graminis f. sp. tritici TaxID=56615 RepID=A0A5B0RB98_PUCGR|nr:hypothetical protein PGT21_013804 [Puccinia graminis f. sp. tritici]KAA1076663.1 hypothetical protein PGT21_015006 [Puccinia graminis f. sp. tritici]KAA1122104.1 hypothetical protein PGTUg99_027860 [Puccinia graminis f. sp. tritici]KAA1126826.1 hypothetical protein PGTUg99_025632 [Puccinia graminis f. sp. tritici]
MNRLRTHPEKVLAQTTLESPRLPADIQAGLDYADLFKYGDFAQWRTASGTRLEQWDDLSLLKPFIKQLLSILSTSDENYE